MILSCERCEAQYTVGDDSIGNSGRKVRCTSCGHVWLQKPDFGKAERANPLISGEFAAAEPTKRKPKAAAAPAGEPAAPSPAAAASTAGGPTMRRFSAPSRKPAAAAAKPKEPGRLRKQLIRIAALALPSAALAAGLIVFRDPLITFWPPIARLYSTIGLPVSATPDLAVRSVRLEEKTTDGHRTILVDGEIANQGTIPLALPRLHATLGEGDAKARWSFSAGSGALDPGATAPFHTERADPPQGARSVSIGVWR